MSDISYIHTHKYMFASKCTNTFTQYYTNTQDYAKKHCLITVTQCAYQSDGADMLNFDSLMSCKASESQTYNYTTAQIKAFYLRQHAEVCRTRSTEGVCCSILHDPEDLPPFDNWRLRSFNADVFKRHLTHICPDSLDDPARRITFSINVWKNVPAYPIYLFISVIIREKHTL